jgi:hypothetical protein
MRTKLLYIALLLGAACAAQELHYKTINTEQVYIVEKIDLNEDNDCSVRALSVAMDITYREAIRQTVRYGRSHGQGMKASDLVRLVKELHSSVYIGLINLNELTPIQFLQLYANESESYIMISKSHTSVLRYKPSMGKWYIYGNVKDVKKKYITAIKLKYND